MLIPLMPKKMSLRGASAGFECGGRRGNRKEAWRLLSEPLNRVVMLIPLMPIKTMSLRGASEGLERRGRRGNRKQAWRLLSEPLIRVIMLIPLMPKKCLCEEPAQGLRFGGDVAIARRHRRLLSEPLIRVIMLIPLMPIKTMSLRGASAGFARWGRRGNRKEAWRLLSEPGFVGFKDYPDT